MKTRISALIVLFLLTASTYSLFAANFSEEKGQQRNVKDFHAVEVSTGIDVIISMGDKESVSIEANDDIINDVITEVKNGTLHIYVKNQSGFNLFNWRNYSSVKAYVSVIELDRLKASAGAEVKSEGTLSGDEIDVDASSGGNINVDLIYKNTKLDASSGAQLDVTGKAKYLKVSTSSGGTIDAGDFNSEYCEARASSGGNATIHSTAEIIASASSGGNIRYSGNPKSKDINKSSGGTVSSR